MYAFLMFGLIYSVVYVGGQLLENCLNLLSINRFKKQIYIIRGVPGIGKHQFCADHHGTVTAKTKKYRQYVVLSDDDYFMDKDGNYVFDRRNVSKASANTYSRYIKALINPEIRMIYVANVNHQQWMFNNYIQLAKICRYQYQVYELVCGDEHELEIYNKRSTHNVPLSFSKKVYKEWESPPHGSTFIFPSKVQNPNRAKQDDHDNHDDHDDHDDHDENHIDDSSDLSETSLSTSSSDEEDEEDEGEVEEENAVLSDDLSSSSSSSSDDDN